MKMVDVAAAVKYTNDVGRRWGGHVKVQDVRFGEYDGCASHSPMLWLHLAMGFRTAVSQKLYVNWRMFLERSTDDSGRCHFLAISTRHETGRSGRMENGNVTDQLQIIDNFFGHNVAWTTHKRLVGNGESCGCATQVRVRHDNARNAEASSTWKRGPKSWPNCVTDWFVTAQLFGKHVAARHRIATSPFDIVVHARPDVWFVSALDHADLHQLVRRKRQQVVLFMNFEDEGTASDVVYVHTREVMERLCVDNFDAPVGPGHPPGCPMCYGTHWINHETEYELRQAAPWSCGWTVNRLMLAASWIGATTGFILDTSGFGACVARRPVSPRGPYVHRFGSLCGFATNKEAVAAWKHPSSGCAPRPQVLCGKVSVSHHVRIAYHAPPAGSNGSSPDQLTWVDSQKRSHSGSCTGTNCAIPRAGQPLSACEHASQLNGAAAVGAARRPRPITSPFGLAQLRGGGGGSHFYATVAPAAL
tara:strand:+ start:1577 stop:2998 length:1422 start_codon:yes stop_codon:yes gene_type:complete